jgi:WD40 repeat protein
MDVGRFSKVAVMKRSLSGLLLVWMLSLPWVSQAQTDSPSPSPTAPPSATAAPFTPPPTPTPTTTPVGVMPGLPALQPITAENVDQLQPLFSLECHDPDSAALSIDLYRNIVWSPVHNLLAVVMFGRVCLYDFGTNSHAGIFIEVRDTWAGVFSPDGETLATLHNGTPSVRLWDTHTGAQKPTSLQAGYNIRFSNVALAYSPDGKYIATASYRGGLRLYDAETEVLLVRVRIPSWAVYFSHDGNRLITLNDDGIGLWTLHPGPQLFQDRVLLVENRAVRDISVALLGDNQFYYQSDLGLMVYDLVQDQFVEVPDTLASINDAGAVFLPDGTPVALYQNDPVRFSSPAFTDMRDWAFSADGRLLATIPFDDSEIIQLWGLLAGG